jgi:hypothetical protein
LIRDDVDAWGTMRPGNWARCPRPKWFFFFFFFIILALNYFVASRWRRRRRLCDRSRHTGGLLEWGLGGFPKGLFFYFILTLVNHDKATWHDADATVPHTSMFVKADDDNISTDEVTTAGWASNDQLQPTTPMTTPSHAAHADNDTSSCEFGEDTRLSLLWQGQNGHWDQAYIS